MPFFSWRSCSRLSRVDLSRGSIFKTRVTCSISLLWSGAFYPMLNHCWSYFGKYVWYKLTVYRGMYQTYSTSESVVCFTIFNLLQVTTASSRSQAYPKIPLAAHYHHCINDGIGTHWLHRDYPSSVLLCLCYS